MLTRRRLIATAAAGLAATAAPRLWAATTVDLGGGASLTTLSDGHLSLPESFLYGDLDPEAVTAIVAATDTAARGLEPPCNVTLLRTGEATVLFDAGAGPGFMPSAGKLPDALSAAGIAADHVTHVVFTHGHPDHLWGVLDDFDEPVFANARHLMGAVEHAYWTDPATVSSISPERQSFAAGAARRLDMLGGGIETFADGDAVLPGVTATMTPGHTPGHMAFEVSAEGGRVILAGDAIGNAHVALKRPEWHAPSDQDPATGAATRTALLNRSAEDGATVVGFHLPGGGIGRITRDGDAFGWDPT